MTGDQIYKLLQGCIEHFVPALTAIGAILVSIRAYGKAKKAEEAVQARAADRRATARAAGGRRKTDLAPA